MKRICFALFLLAACAAAVAQDEATKSTVRGLWDDGAAKYHQGDRAGAIELWEKALQLDPDNAAIRKKVAETRAELAASAVQWPTDLNTYQVLKTDPPAYLTAGTTMVPFRRILEWMGAEVGYDNGIITAGLEARKVKLTAGSKDAEVDGRPITLAAPATVRDGVTFVPLRFLCEGLGADVKWDAAAQRVYVHRAAKFAYVDLPDADGQMRTDGGPTGSNAVTGLADSRDLRRPGAESGDAPASEAAEPAQPRPAAAGNGGGGAPRGGDGGGFTGGGNCPRGGNHVPGKTDRRGRLHCAKCGRYM